MAKSAKQQKQQPQPKPALISYDFDQRAAALAPALEAAETVSKNARESRSGAESLLTAEIVLMHEAALSNGHKPDAYFVAMFGNGGKQSNKVTGRIEAKMVADGFKLGSAASILSRARTVCAWAIADYEAFRKASVDDKGQPVRLTKVIEAKKALEKPTTEPPVKTTEPESIEAFITRMGMHRIFAACANLLKAERATATAAKTCEALAAQVKPLVMAKGSI